MSVKLKPCEESAIQIGQAISSIEAIGRMPPSALQGNLAKSAEAGLASLQSEYENNCLPSVKQT